MKVRDALRLIEADGWYLVTTRGSHRQYEHPTKTGRVTVVGHPGDDLPAGTLNSILKQAQLKPQGVAMYRFLVVIEKAEHNYAAYSPDLPGCIATGETLEEVERNMHDAIQMHVEGLQEDELPVPQSQAVAEYMAVQG